MMHLNFLVVDVETNGLSPDDNEIIDIGLVKIKHGEISDSFTSRVKPKTAIPHAITALTGITNEDVANAPPFSEIVGHILMFAQNMVIVGHNVNFDMSMINRALVREGLPALQNDTIDTINMFALISPMAPSYKLEDIAEQFLGETTTFHQALADAIITAKLFIETIRTLETFNLNLLYHVNRLLSQIPCPIAYIINRCYERRIKLVDQHDYINMDWKSLVGQARIAEEQVAHPNDDLTDENDFTQLLELIGPEIDTSVIYENIQKSFDERTYLLLEVIQNKKNIHQFILSAAVWATGHSTPVAIVVDTPSTEKHVKESVKLLSSLAPGLKVAAMQHPENYVCLSKFDVLMQSIHEKANPDDIIEFAPLLTWLHQTKTGNTSELHKKIYYKFHKYLYSDPTLCLNYKCTHTGQCFVRTANNAAAKSHLLLIDTHTLIGDPQVRQFIPEFNYLLIFDAHHLIKQIENYAIRTLSAKQICKYSDVILLRAQSVINSSEENHETITHNHNICNLIQSLSLEFIQEILHFHDLIYAFFDFLSLSAASTVKQDVTDTKICKLLEPCLDQLNRNILIAEKLQNTLESESLTLYKNLLFCVIDVLNAYKNLKLNLELIHTASPLYHGWIEVLNKKNNVFSLIHTVRNSYLNDFKYMLWAKHSVVFTSPNLTVKNKFDHFIASIEDPASPRKKIELSIENELSNLLYIKYDYSNLHKYKAIKTRQQEVLKALSQAITGKLLIITNKPSAIPAIYSYLSRDNGVKRLIMKQEGNRTHNANLKVFRSNPGLIYVTTYDFVDSIDLSQEDVSAAIFIDLPVDDITQHSTRYTLNHLKQKGINWLNDHILPKASIKFRSVIHNLNTISNKTVVINLSIKTNSPYMMPYFKPVNCSSTESNDLSYLLKAINLWLN